MISTRPGTEAHRILAALVQLGDATADDLVPRLPALSADDVRSPRRLDIIRSRQQVRDAERARIGRVLGRLQEAGLVETRGPAQLSAAWTALCARRPAVDALRLMSGWSVLEADAGPYLDLCARVEVQPGCVAALSGQDGARYRQLVRWDVVVPPSVRRATEAGIALVGCGV